ncbi:MAG: diguanylate cyclase, partial [Rhodoferax sp.]|nr:diguanylate cyclase [Rhodoferax sp.]
MQGQSYFQLISPLIFLVFSCGFIVLWHFARDIVALRVFAVSYFLGACGLLGDFLRPLMGVDVAIFTVNPLYIATAVTFSGAMFLFYRRRAPWRILAAIGLAMFAAMAWFRLGVDSISVRTLIMNGGGFVLFAYPAYALRREMMRSVDRVLQALVFLNGLQLLLRTLVIIWYEGDTLTSANYAESLAAMTFQLSVSFAALAIAVNLFVMFGMEIVSGITETSHTDPLTGVFNRRGFDARIGEYAGEGLSGNHAVIVADIDRFKSINDRFG